MKINIKAPIIRGIFLLKNERNEVKPMQDIKIKKGRAGRKCLSTHWFVIPSWM